MGFKEVTFLNKIQKILFMSEEKRQLIREKLDDLKERLPKLEYIVDLIDEDLNITPELIKTVKEYPDKSNMNYFLPLGILIEQKSSLKKRFDVDLDFLKKVKQYFEALGIYDKDKDVYSYANLLNKDDIPKTFATKLNISRTNPRHFFNKFAVIPYHNFLNGKKQYQNLEIDEDLSFMNRFYDSRFISEEIINKFIKDGFTMNQTLYYFDTGVLELDLRNMIFFSQNIIDSKINTKITQGRISSSINRSFEIKKKSIPELNFFIDIADLIYSEVIDVNRLEDSSRNQVLRLLYYSRDFEDLDKIMQENADKFLLTGEKIESLLSQNIYSYIEELDQGISQGGSRYKSGIFFNILRLMNKLKDYSKFEIYYENINEERLKKRILDHFLKYSDKKLCDRFINIYTDKKEDFPGIGMRELANILFFIDYIDKNPIKFPEFNGKNYSKYLPAVALFKLGYAEYGKNNENKRHITNRKSNSHLSDESIPLLKEILVFKKMNTPVKEKAYIINPLELKKELPDDSKLMIPEIFSLMYEIPENVEIVAKGRKLKLGQKIDDFLEELKYSLQDDYDIEILD